MVYGSSSLHRSEMNRLAINLEFSTFAVATLPEPARNCPRQVLQTATAGQRLMGMVAVDTFPPPLPGLSTLASAPPS